MPDDGPIFSHQPTIGTAQLEGEPADTRSVDMRESYPDGYDEEYGDGYDDGAPMVEVRGSPVAPPMVRQSPPMYQDDPCVTIGGKADTPTNAGIRRAELLCQINNDSLTNPTFIAPLDTEVVNGAVQGSTHPRLWLLQTFAEESTWNTDGTAQPATLPGAWPAVRVAGFTTALPGGGYSGRSWLRARVRWDAPGTGGTFDMDLGGSPIEIYAQQIRMTIIVPFNHQEIFEGVINPWIGGFNTLLSLTEAELQIVPIEESRGLRVTTLTMRQEAAANTQIGFQIPAYAKRVTLYQAAAGAASAAWTFEVGPMGAATSSIEIGQLPFVAGARRTNQIDIVPGATHIQSDVDVANARLFTAVWEIEI